MKTVRIVWAVLVAALATGCARVAAPTSPISARLGYAADQEAPVTSLFPSDQAVLSDEAVARILSSHVELPSKARLAVIRFPEGGRYYWRDEEFLRLQQSQIDALTQALSGTERVASVTPLPSLMIPSRISIPTLRESALRMQADLLVIFRIGNDTYSQSRVFAKDKAKAYSTCEVVLVDTRSGLVPFTRVVSREHQEAKESGDLDLSETLRRAERIASTEALKAAGADLEKFLR